jgi:hypothetical protein
MRLCYITGNDIHSRVIARSASDVAIPVAGSEMRLPSGVYPELCEILRCAQNDIRRRARNDRREITGNDIHSRVIARSDSDVAIPVAAVK